MFNMKQNQFANKEYFAPYLELLQTETLGIFCASGNGSTEDLIIDENYGW